MTIESLLSAVKIAGSILTSKSSSEEQPKIRLDAIQHLRAIASISVLLFHASHLLHLKGVESEILSRFGWHFGRFGVVMFFTISGFLMARIMVHASPNMFLFQRVTRIYPTYWAVAILVLLLHLAGGEQLSFDIRALLLLPGGAWQYLLGVEWTLPYELVFYAFIFFLLCFRAEKHVNILSLVWIILIIAIQNYWPQIQIFWQFPSIFQLPWIDFSSAFACGLLIPAFLRYSAVRLMRGFLGLASLFLSEYVAAYSMSFLIAGCALLVAAAASSKLWNNVDLSFLRKLGDWSFAIYLCHVPVILLFSGTFLNYLNPVLLWAGSIAAAMLVGCSVGAVDVNLHKFISIRRNILPNYVLSALNCTFLLSLAYSIFL
jgi:peptidoglycan/LPS O-acetylase OafA/YrhL